jgi:heme exporter protein A
MRNTPLKPDSNRKALLTEGLTKEFHGIKALDDVHFTLNKGEFLSLFGPNGAGKTTLLKILASLIKPTAGRVCIMETGSENQGEDAKKKIGFVSHHSLLYFTNFLNHLN